jgi:antirestriction protein
MTNATIQVYVSTYAKYNSGNLKGAWVDLETYDTEDLFNVHITELHNDEVDPEFMIQDFEGFPREFYSECGLDSRVFEWLELTDSDRERVAAFLDCFGDCAGDLFEASENAYQGTYDSDLDFAHEIVASCYNLEEPLASYFDYDKFARDLMIDHSSSNGFYFSSNW